MQLAEIAERNSKKELPAYLDFDGVILEKWPEYDDGPDKIGMRLSITVKNYGKTPAENAEAAITRKLQIVGKPGFTDTMAGQCLIAAVAPTDHFNQRYRVVVSEKFYEDLKAERIIHHLSFIVTYTDVFGDPHLLRSCFQGCLGESSVVEGTRASN